MTEMYNYRSIKKVSKEGILFDDNFFLDFESSRKIWAKKHNIPLEGSRCVGERDILADMPYIEFYFDNFDHVVVYFNRRFYNNWDNNFHKLMFSIEKMGYSTYDLT